MIRPFAAFAVAAALALPASADQLSRSLGMPEGVYTTAELMLMREARQDHEPLVLRRTIERAVADGSRAFLPNWNPGAEPAATAPRRPGAAGLAAAMGVDPADHTTAELAAMFIDAHD